MTFASNHYRRVTTGGALTAAKLPLNTFIRQHAAFNHAHGVSRVYVVVKGTDSRVLAYYALSAGTFLRDHLPPDDQAGLPRYPLPTVHLGRLAVDRSCQGQQLGKLLLFHFLKKSCGVAEEIGVFSVDLFSKDEDAKRFYLKYGFIPMQDDAFHLYLPMATLRTMFARAADSAQAPEQESGGRGG
jgi:hypothetical protein